MEWTGAIRSAVDFIENNICDELSIDEIARHVNISPFYFQKGFSLLCGMSVSEYVRNRRLTLAASELVSTNAKVIDVALKYGYDSPDSFTKAFTRFHGITPTMVKKDDAILKSFAPLKIILSLESGSLMNYKIMKKDSFTLLGAAKTFKYEGAHTEVPKFWTEHYQKGLGQYVCGMYGVSIDENMDGGEFEYLIADNYNPAKEIPQGLVTKVIPEYTWAVFPCTGGLPDTLQNTNNKIFSEWLPNCKDYEIAAGICVEMYDDPCKYPDGVKDKNYYCELWIPVKTKA